MNSKIFKYLVSIIVSLSVLYIVGVSYMQISRFRILKAAFDTAISNETKLKLYDLEKSRKDNFIEAFFNRNNTEILKGEFINFYNDRIENATSVEIKNNIKSDINSNPSLNDIEKSELINKIDLK